MYMLYSKARLTRLLGIPAGLISNLEKEGVIKPIKRVGKRRYYGFKEYLSLRTICKLRDNGVSPKKMVTSVKLIKQRFQSLKSPLTEVKFIPYGKELLMKYGGQLLDMNGQYFLPQMFESDKVDIYPMAETAWYWFNEAGKYDQDPESYEKAESYYRQALEYKPDMVEALVNLGTLYYKSARIRTAEEHYLKALELDSENPSLLYNLGNLYDEKKEDLKAIEFYEKAIQLKKNYADAHYNIALLYMRLDRLHEALYHFEYYIILDKESLWSEIAKKQIENIKKRMREG